MFKKVLYVQLFLAVIIYTSSAFAMSADEEGGDSQVIQKLLSQEKVAVEKLPIELLMREKIEQEKPSPALPEGKTFIKEVEVVGSTVISKKELTAVIEEFQNRELSAKEMQRCSDQITDAYNIAGYITSYAYATPEKLGEGILLIRCFEGKVGEVKIEGNRYFSKDVYEDRMGLKEGDVFNIKLLKNNLRRTNKHPDRKVSPDIKATDTLARTDIALTVKDKLPLHANFDYDNYGSQFILYKRYKNTFYINNNLTGHDDTLSLKAQFAEADAQQLYDLDYFLPLTNNLKWELYYMPFKRENYYDRDKKDIQFEKLAYKWYTVLWHTVISEPNRDLVFNYGFVQKFIHWYAFDIKQKQDRFCALFAGFDFSRSDDYGTWAVSESLEQGIPRMFGASTAEDSWCSVKGAGGKYLKQKFTLARRQKLFQGIESNSKIQMQYSTQACTGVNVFSVGGFMGTIDNRGYPRASMPMDSGYYLMEEVFFPAYLLPKNIKIPFSKGTFYDNFKVFAFVEYAKGYKRSPQSAGDKAGSIDPEASGKQDDDRRKSLSSAGCGFVFNIPDKGLSARLDIGWPLNHKLPMDGDHAHIWYRVTKNF